MSEWTQEELRNLEILFPENVKRDARGRPFPTITKEEANYLLNSYPSMFPDGQAPVAGPRSEEERALAARYPTMYKPKK